MSLATELATEHWNAIAAKDEIGRADFIAAINEAIERCAWQLEIAVPGHCLGYAKQVSARIRALKS